MFSVRNPTPTTPGHDRRRQRRDRVLVQSRAYIGPFGERATCIIRDWSTDGARIKLINSYPTDAVNIDLDILGERRKARVVWRDNQEIGVTFTIAPDPVDAQIAALRETLRQLFGH